MALEIFNLGCVMVKMIKLEINTLDAILYYKFLGISTKIPVKTGILSFCVREKDEIVPNVNDNT